jgi:hypothetical protein
VSAKGVAELIADRGEAAAGDDFFRSRPFFDAEAVTHTLRIAAGGLELLAPLIVSKIPPPTGLKDPYIDGKRPVGRLIDGVSPYGYPGVGGDAQVSLDPATVDFGATGLVTAFIRHTLGEPALARASERNVVQIADP